MECVNYKSNTKYNIYHAFILPKYQRTFIMQFLQNEIPFVIFKMFLSVHLSTKNVPFLFDYCNTVRTEVFSMKSPWSVSFRGEMAAICHKIFVKCRWNFHRENIQIKA